MGVAVPRDSLQRAVGRVSCGVPCTEVVRATERGAGRDVIVRADVIDGITDLATADGTRVIKTERNNGENYMSCTYTEQPVSVEENEG